MRSYLYTMRDLGAETWIMHGTLLGWWWNRKVRWEFFRCSVSWLLTSLQILPWDSDIDVQVSASTIQFLANFYNMTVHSFHARDFMLEINPQYVDGSVEDDLNTIDGRYIDTETGLFIDITTVRPKENAPGILTCKDTNEYNVRGRFRLIFR